MNCYLKAKNNKPYNYFKTEIYSNKLKIRNKKRNCELLSTQLEELKNGADAVNVHT